MPMSCRSQPAFRPSIPAVKARPLLKRLSYWQSAENTLQISVSTWLRCANSKGLSVGLRFQRSQIRRRRLPTVSCAGNGRQSIPLRRAAESRNHNCEITIPGIRPIGREKVVHGAWRHSEKHENVGFAVRRIANPSPPTFGGEETRLLRFLWSLRSLRSLAMTRGDFRRNARTAFMP